jgi:type IV pilus assembly protein PilP
MIRARALFAFALLGAACGSPPPPPRRALPPAPAAKVADDALAEQPETMYVYSPIGKRDPFQNVFGAREAAPTHQENRKPTPLQKWSLDQLRLAMTVTGTASPMAVLEAPDTNGWSVRVGDFVGKNWGKVTSIQPNQIVVTETITDQATGRVYPQDIKLVVPTSKEEEIDFKALQEGEEMSQSPQQARAQGGR